MSLLDRSRRIFSFAMCAICAFGLVGVLSTDADARMAKRSPRVAAETSQERWAKDDGDRGQHHKKDDRYGRRGRGGSSSDDWSDDDRDPRKEVPEISPGAARGAAILLLGGIALLRSRRRVA